MLKRLLNFIIGIIGAVSAHTALRRLYPYGIVSDGILNTLIFIGIALGTFIVFYIISAIILNNLSKITDETEKYLRESSNSSYEFILGSIGFITGLAVATLISIPILRIEFVGIPITLIILIVSAYLGRSVVLRFKNDRIFAKLRQKYYSNERDVRDKLIDSSAIIDGRIYDITAIGFIEGKIVLPQFVIDELAALADSEDDAKRAKGRRGLDLLSDMQKEFGDRVVVESYDVANNKGIDDILIDVALQENLGIITNDFNLNKVAKIKNIKVLNINELANALKPLANVGDEIKITIDREGKERAQGIGYLESGVMVIVENTKDRVGETLDVVITSVIQTSAGRMLFAKLK